MFKQAIEAIHRKVFANHRKLRSPVPITIDESLLQRLEIEKVAGLLKQLEDYIPPEELIVLLEPYITEAQGRIIQRKIEDGTYGQVKRHPGERYD